MRNKGDNKTRDRRRRSPQPQPRIRDDHDNFYNCDSESNSSGSGIKKKYRVPRAKAHSTSSSFVQASPSNNSPSSTALDNFDKSSGLNVPFLLETSEGGTTSNDSSR